MGLASAQETLGPNEFIRVRDVTLPDGLRVVAVEQPSASVVTLALAIDGGRGDEPEAGLALAAAETWFRTQIDPVVTVRGRYERVGALTETFVDADTTVFTTRVKPAGLPTALRLEWLRFAAPLEGVDEIAALTPGEAWQENRARHLDDVYQALFDESHPYRGLWRVPGDRPPFYLASAWVTETWLPESSTLVVAGPIDPETFLCDLHPVGCEVTPASVVETPLVLPEPTLTVKAKGERRREIGPLARGVEPTVLLAWALPGADTLGVLLPEIVFDRIQGELQAVLPKSRCRLETGRAAAAVVCELPADVDQDELDRTFRKGWDTRKLAKDVELWRTRRLNGLLGTSAEPSFPARLARHLRQGGEPGPYAGLLEDLAFDETAVEQLLEGPASYRSALWVRLGP